MSPQESDEDKSDYNLVVDEVSRGLGPKGGRFSRVLGGPEGRGFPAPPRMPGMRAMWG